MTLRIKSALFVDFDNMFIGLKDDPRAAEEFGRGVKKWLWWIEHEMPLPGGATVRDILVRRCYGNPETFAAYRGYFTRNAFSVVDCPPLTRFGKNSADIVMVMDILDILGHATQFDEFIIMSADADFTPVVLRLRMHDRRTVAIVAGNAAAAYTASCDLVVTDDEFVERALRLPALPAPRAATPPAPTASPALLDAIAGRVYQEASSTGEVPGARLPDIYREFREFTANSNWLGFYSLRALTEALVARRPELRLTDDEPWKVAVDVSDRPPATGTTAVDGEAGNLRDRMVEAVRRFMRNADGPRVMARVAQHVLQTVGPQVLETRWAGAGTFRNFLDGVSDLGLAMVSSPQPGYIYDPARHAPPEPSSADTRPPNLDGLPDEMASFIRRISELTNTPRLSPRQYATMFEVIAREVQRTPYEITNTSRAVRDQMLERGESVSRQYAMFVLRGINFGGYRFRRTGVDEAPALARAFLANVYNLLRGAQVVLTGRERELLEEWLLPSAGTGADDAASADAGAEWPASDPDAGEPAWQPEPAQPADGTGEPWSWGAAEEPAFTWNGAHDDLAAGDPGGDASPNPEPAGHEAAADMEAGAQPDAPGEAGPESGTGTPAADPWHDRVQWPPMHRGE
ncbi:MAG TPA: NYN domain-containing protein [Longimicrobium sp.]|nr:NYN domain-containing protein [Longimicrobium sp.]